MANKDFEWKEKKFWKKNIYQVLPLLSGVEMFP